MDADDLAAREHANFIASFTVVASVAGGVARRTGGVAALLSGLPLAGFNLVAIEDAHAADGTVADAIAFARQRGVPFSVDLRDGVDDRFLPLLADLGLVPHAGGAAMPGMALRPIPGAVPDPPPGHVIRGVTDERGIADHVRVASVAFGITVDVMSAIVNQASARLPEVALYVGYVDGEAVSTGIGIRSGRTIGVYNVATAEGARRRGYGEAMTRRIAGDGAANGCDVAILQASEDGFALYDRLGYREVVRYRSYVEPMVEEG